MAGDALTIRQASALLGVHTNTVRNRIKSGRYQAAKVVTEHGETYPIQREELEQDLEQDLPTNNLSTPSPIQEPSQPLPDVREAMRAMLEPFVRELGEVREELGREKELRKQAERRVEELESQREARESPESPGPSHTSTARPGERLSRSQSPHGRARNTGPGGAS